MSKKDNPSEAYNEWMLVAAADGDVLETKKVGRRGETWDAPELNIAPPVTHPPVPLRRLSRQGRKTRHSGRIIFVLDESPPPTKNPAIVYHGLTLAMEDAAAGRTRGQVEETTALKRVNMIAAMLAVIIVVSTVFKVLAL